MYHAHKGSRLPASRVEAEKTIPETNSQQNEENRKPVLSMQKNVLPQSEKWPLLQRVWKACAVTPAENC